MNRFRSLQSNTAAGLAALFAAFMLSQLIILRLGNQAGRGYLSEARQTLVYCFIQIAVILGFLFHALIYRRTRGAGAYKRALAAALGIVLIGAEIMLFAPEGSAFYLAVTGLTVFALGLTGGAVYLRLSAYTACCEHAGVCLSAGYAAAIALQYIFQLRWTVKPALAVLLLACLVVIFLLIKDSAEIDTPRDAPAAPPKKLIFAAVIALSMLVFTGYYTAYIHRLQIASGYMEYNAYSWPRLLMIPGMLLFGVLGDRRNGKYLPIGALCMAALALLNAVLIGRETYWLNMCMYYLAMTAVVSYYHLTFLRLAPSSGHPAIWACAGRLLDSAVVILTFIFGISSFSSAAVLAVDIAALAVMVVSMALSGDFDLSAPPPVDEKTPPPDPFPAMQAQFGLTPTELRVLRELVLTDDKQEAIAAGMNISVSTLRHHVTAIYRKTGAQTRAALCKLAASDNR